MPPLCCISPSIPDASNVTTIRLPIESTPSPIKPSIDSASVSAYVKPTTNAATIPMSSTNSTFNPTTAKTMTSRYGIISCQSTDTVATCVSTLPPITKYIANMTNAAGTVSQMLTLNLSRIEQPCDRVAAIVVSDINDRLSPKKEPPTTTATNIGMLPPISPAIPIATGVRATTVPTDVPTAIEIKQAAKKSPGIKYPAGNTLSVKLTVASVAPTFCASMANAPARINIHTIYITSLLAAPLENTFNRSASGNRTVVATPHTDDKTKATDNGTV